MSQGKYDRWQHLPAQFASRVGRGGRGAGALRLRVCDTKHIFHVIETSAQGFRFLSVS